MPKQQQQPKSVSLLLLHHSRPNDLDGDESKGVLRYTVYSTILLVYYTIHTPADVFELIAIVEEREGLPGLPIDMK